MDSSLTYSVFCVWHKGRNVNLLQIYVKVEVTPWHACAGTRGREGVSRYSSNPFAAPALEGMGGRHQAPAAVPPRKDVVFIVQETALAFGPVQTDTENLFPHRDSIPVPSSP